MNEVFYELLEATIQAFCTAYGIEDPRTDADGPDIEFIKLFEAALREYNAERDALTKD